MGDTARRAWARLGPPRSLHGRMRWFFLAFALFFVLTFWPQLALQSNRSWPVRCLAIALLFCLGLWWVRCYRRGRFPVLGWPLECAAFFACVLTPTDPFKGLGLLYIAVNFRALWGRLREVVGFTVVTTGCFVAGVLLAPLFGSPDQSFMLGYVLPGIPPVALIGHLVAGASQRAERAAAREHLLSRAGLAIAEAGTADATRGQALDAVAELLADVPGASAQYVDPSGATIGVIGAVPQTTTGSPVDAGHAFDIPLRIEDRLTARLRIRSPEPLPEEIGDALSVLAAQLSLALSNAALTEHLRRQASHDPLTGLANRRTLDRRLGHLLDDERQIAVLLLDLDGFKQVNDTLGHEAGDQLLITLADRLAGRCREGDLVARLGGDEFVVVLSNERDRHELLTTGERLLDAVRQPVAVPGRTVTVGASIGIAVGGPGATIADLLREADTAMYTAKRAGRNRICVADEVVSPR